MASDLFQTLGPILDAATGIVFMLAILAAILIGGIFVIWSGYLEPKPYFVRVYAQRSNGLEERNARGRFLKGKDSGKFEIFYPTGFFGMMSDRVRLEAPTDEYIHFGNRMFFYRPDQDTHIPIKMNLNMETLMLEPGMSPAARLAFASETKESALRFTKPNWLQKFADHGALLVAAIILGLTFIIAVNAVSSGLFEVAEKLSGLVGQNQACLEALAEAGKQSGSNLPPG